MRSNKGFSLVELMIVVAIIGILAAIAIPNFMTMQLKAKRAEIPSNVDGIKTAELSYDAAFDGFINAVEAPRADDALDKTAVNFDYGTIDGWTQIGWQPDGLVRGNYSVDVVGSTDFTIQGDSDVDDDNDNIATYTASKLVNATLDGDDIDAY